MESNSIVTSLAVTLGSSLLLFLLWKVQARLQKVRRWIYFVEQLPGVPLRESPHPWLVDLGRVNSCPKTPHSRAADQVKDSLPLMQTTAEEYGEQGLYKWWVFNPYRFPFITSPLVFVSDPVIIPQVLGSKAFGKFDRGVMFSLAKPLVGDSFLAAPDGDTWKHQRRLVQPGFSQKSLTETTRTTVSLLEKDLFPAWDRFASSDPTTPVSVLPWMKRMAIDVLGRVAFSHSFGGIESFAAQSAGLDKAHSVSTKDANVTLYETFTVISTAITKRSQNPLLALVPNRKYNNACKTLDETISLIVDQRFKLLEQHETGTKDAPPLPMDLLSYLVQKDETGHVLDQKDIVGNIRMFLFAGQDTTSSAISFCLWYIAKHTKVQDLLFEEINSLMNERAKNGTTDMVSDAELRKLPYLEAVLKETLRFTPPAAVARETLQDVTVTNARGVSYVLPKGVQVYITPFVLQRSRRYWPDRPLEFVPERHLKQENTRVENTSLESDGASPLEKPFVPFSMGPRNCIGQHLAMTEMRAAITLIVYRYKLQPAPNAIEPCPTMTMTVNPHEVLVTLSRRP